MESFGHYELLGRLSAGGMAEVFRARDTRRGTLVALKRILPSIAEDDDFVAMFIDEARIASSMEHPHIARLLEFGEAEGHFFIAFELVEGKELRTLFDHAVLSEQRPPLSVVLHVLARVAEGLAYAHARKDAQGAPRSIVHRDVSPQNILVSMSGDVKLIDFGIAKAAGKIARTGAGTLKGKFGYMSPEQVRGIGVDQRTDVFSLGVCMWELLTLRRLFAAGHELLVLDMVKNHVPEAPSVLVPSLPSDLDEIARKALAKNPDERYGSAREFYRDLYAFIETAGLNATRDEIARYMRRAFPSGSSPPGPTKSTQGGIMQLQETRRMSDENKGSDLDIFEGLGKKGPPSQQSSAAPPPPPGSGQHAAPPAPPGAEMKKTLMGMPPMAVPVPPAPPTTPTGSAAPPPPPGASAPPLPPPAASVPPPLPVSASASAPPGASAPPAPPTSGSMRAVSASKPPPPPGRGSLPALANGPTSQPPQQAATPSATVRSAPPPVSGKAIPAAAPSSNTPSSSRQLDMDWDDDDEATHVFDKESRDREKAAEPAVPERASMDEILSRPPPPPAAGSGVNGSSPLGQLRSGPPPSQSMRSAPPPPPASIKTSDRPSAGMAFARASGAPAEQGPMQTPPPPPPGQTRTAPMVMPGGSPSAPPPQHPASVPPHSVHPSAPPAASVPPPQLPPVSRAMEATAMVPRQQQSRAGLYVALVLLVALVAGAAVFLLMPRAGNLVINVADSKGGAVSKMEVWVDGTKRCDSAPCIVREISAGVHEVKVVAQGYDPAAPRAVTVSARQDATTDFSLVAASRMGGTGFKVAGTQPGVKLWVDGKEIGPLPQDLRELTAGEHTVKFAASERYAALEKTVTVKQDEVQDLGNIVLKVLKGKATISLATPGAKVYLVSGTDRRELPTLPISVDIDTSKSWALEATKLGMGDFREEISFEDGQAEKTFTVLVPAKGAAAVTAPPPATPAWKPPTTTPPATTAAPATTTPPAETAKPAAATTTKKPAAGGEAFLNINSLPASTVVLDGKPLGPTPKLKVPVSAGNHTIMFVNSELKLKKSINVSVGAGETKAAFTKLRD
ncbi:MAG: protein kinase [Myxococcales bacterium]|nr:protein kinase [Myxococcales bacterium]